MTGSYLKPYFGFFYFLYLGHKKKFKKSSHVQRPLASSPMISGKVAEVWSLAHHKFQEREVRALHETRHQEVKEHKTAATAQSKIKPSTQKTTQPLLSAIHITQLTTQH